MATRIYAIPDKDGIIRVSCGADELEIVVTGGATAKASRKKASPFDQPSPFDRPQAMHIPDFAGEGGGINVDAIVRRVRAQKKAPHLPDPDGVVLRRRGPVDLHDVSRLSSRLRRSGSKAGLGVRFDDDG
ncbi:MAG TPA: hypothetical protein VGX37_05690 [Allosphingosinicella sp.]|jgi:hypothetical protein|nr:hypothetical protein [Allosphingosinicella sp.]